MVLIRSSYYRKPKHIKLWKWTTRTTRKQTSCLLLTYISFCPYLPHLASEKNKLLSNWPVTETETSFLSNLLLPTPWRFLSRSKGFRPSPADWLGPTQGVGVNSKISEAIVCYQPWWLKSILLFLFHPTSIPTCFLFPEL